MTDIINELKQKYGISTPPAQPKEAGDDTVARVLDDEFSKLGYTPTSRLSILGDVGRENSWNRDTIFKGHHDPANDAYNRGIISWQGDRQKKLQEYLKGEGVLGRGDDNELRGMARFMDRELRDDYPDVYNNLRNAKSTYDASEALRKYIKYVPNGQYNSFDPQFRVKNNRDWAEKARTLGLAQASAGGTFDYQGAMSKILGGGKPQPAFDYKQSINKVAGNPPSNEVLNPAIPQPQVKPVPETANTINEQVLSAMNPASPRSAVLLTDKSQLPLLNSMSRFTRISLPEGDLFVNARKLKVKPKDIPGFVKQNGFANLIGKVEDVGNNTAQGTALRSEDENGNELNTSIVSHEKIHSQALADVAQFPDKVANQEVLSAQDAVQKRVDELTGIGEAAKRGERYVPDQPDMPQMEQSGGDPYQEYLKEFPNFAKQGEKPLSNEEFNSKLADAEKADVGKGAQAVEYTTQPHIAITPAKPVSPANKTGGKQPQQPTPANPQSKEVSATVAWMAGRGDAREYAFDDAASKIAKQIGVDYAAARQYIGRNQFQQGPLSSERAERAKRGRHEITIALDPAAVNELKAIDSRNKETLALYNSKLDEYGKTEIPTIADLLARKDAGLKQVDGIPIDDAIQKERDAYQRGLGEQGLASNYSEPDLQGEARRAINVPIGAMNDELEAKRREFAQGITKEYGSFAGREKEQQRIEKEYEYRPLARPLEFARNFGAAIPKAVSSLLKATDIAGQSLVKADAYLSGQDTNTHESPLYDLGNAIDKYIDSNRNKDLKGEKFVTVLPDTLGQLAVQLFAGTVSGGATVPLLIGASQGASQQYEDAKSSNATSNQKIVASLVGAAAAVPDAFLFHKWFSGASEVEKTGFLNNFAKSLIEKFGVKYGEKEAETLTRATLGQWAKNMAFGGLGEGAQELSENKIDDALAYATYDQSPERRKKLTTLNENDVTSTLAGILGGGIGGGLETHFENVNADQRKEFTDQAFEQVSDLLSKGEITPEKSEAIKQQIIQAAEEADKGAGKQKFDGATEVPIEAKPETNGTQPTEKKGIRQRIADVIDPKRAERLAEETERRTNAEREVESDPLTGVANRKALDKALPTAEKDAATSVVAFDANNFGQINKKVSQEAGDKAIVEIGGAIKQAAEENDVNRVFRRGGDEFVVLAPKETADKIRARAEEIYGEKDYQGVKVSLTGTVGNTFADADSILQTAKAERKNGKQTTIQEPAEPLDTAEDVSTEVAAAAQPEAPQTVTHPNESINGKEIIAQTPDGRVVVPNPENKNGVSVVKNRESEANVLQSEKSESRIAGNEEPSRQTAKGPELREPRAPKSEPHQGKETQVRIPDSQNSYKAKYAVRELEDVIPSHNPFNFQPNPDYFFTNDRHYEKEKQYQEQVRTRSSAESFDPSQLINNSPTSEIGPPIIDQDGNALGGNSRTMILHRIYDGKDARAREAYLNQLKQDAGIYGLDVDAISKMKRPVLVRAISDDSIDAQHAITDLNKTSTTALTSAERSIAEAGKLTDDSVDFIAGKIEAAGSDATLNDALNHNGKDIVNRLIDDGVFGGGERNTLLDGNAITADGKARIERLLTGRVFEDLDQLEYAPSYLKRNIQRAISPLIKTQADTKWNIIPETREAIDLSVRIQRKRRRYDLEGIRRSAVVRPPGAVERFVRRDRGNASAKPECGKQGL
jgi:diguanylate cyclase (GGDEF)-like protein